MDDDTDRPEEPQPGPEADAYTVLVHQLRGSLQGLDYRLSSIHRRLEQNERSMSVALFLLGFIAVIVYITAVALRNGGNGAATG